MIGTPYQSLMDWKGGGGAPPVSQCYEAEKGARWVQKRRGGEESEIGLRLRSTSFPLTIPRVYQYCAKYWTWKSIQ